MRVERGWLRMLIEGDVVTLGSWSSEASIDSEGYVELGARSRTRIRWSGTASAAVSGGAAFGLRPTFDRAHPAAIHLVYFADAELEARRGVLQVELPGGWFLDLDGAVLGARQLADGRTELVHRGGKRVHLRRGSGDDGNELVLASGECLVLGGV